MCNLKKKRKKGKKLLKLLQKTYSKVRKTPDALKSI